MPVYAGVATEFAAPVALASELAHGIANNELQLRYQPVVSLTSGEITGLEALIRWHHPRHGLLQPGAFLKVAERTKLLRSIDRWALGAACQQMAAWRQRFPDRRWTLSVNLGAGQLTTPTLPDEVKAVLATTGLVPHDLKLEITESAQVGQTTAAVANVEALRAFGVGVHLDDFGTGYACLGYLHRFTSEALKIDRSFIAEMAVNPTCDEIVRSVVELAHRLELVVIAEGVESASQVRRLIDLGCDHAQGFYFAAPLVDEEVEELLAKRPARGRRSFLPGPRK